MKVGICNPVSEAARVRAARADFIEENVQSFLAPESSDDAFAEKLAAAAAATLPVIAANCFLPGALKCTGPSVDMPRLLKYAETAFVRAGRAGVEAIVFGSAGARQVPDGWSRDEAFAQFVDLVKRIAPMARESGVVIVVEPLHRAECNFINSLAEGARVVEAASHPSVGLLADIFHMMRDGEGADEIARHGALLRHVHIAEKAERTPPGVAGDDFGPYLRALKTAGYEGPISIECRWKDFAAEAPKAVAFLRGALAAAGF